MKKGISLEGLKLIACVTMLIDHIGYEVIYALYLNATVGSGEWVPGNMLPGDLYRLYYLCRIIGRLSLPIFAFLLVEGIHHTRNRNRYAIRLAIGAVLSEIPYDLIVSGEIFWQEQSIMVTLLLGYFAVLTMERCRTLAWKPLAAVPFVILGELLKADYGWQGVMLVVLFELSRYVYSRNLVRLGGMLVLFHTMDTSLIWIGNVSIPMQAMGALAMVFIVGYDGRKVTNSKAIQWAFYLFYPLHLLILWAIGLVIAGTPMAGITLLAG